eukprot:9548441-Alexandrium_andersonii.AAC.1
MPSSRACWPCATPGSPLTRPSKNWPEPGRPWARLPGRRKGCRGGRPAGPWLRRRGHESRLQGPTWT